MNAAFGAVSAGGAGRPLLDVIQSGGDPNALVANQSDGNAGGMTLSKFSCNTTGTEHGPWHKEVAVGVAPAAELSIQPATSSSPGADPGRVTACEEPISSNAAIPAAINKATQSTFCNRVSVNERLFPS